MTLRPTIIVTAAFVAALLPGAASAEVPDAEEISSLRATIEVRSDGTLAVTEEIIAFCRERLASYKVPRQVVFRDSLPKSGVGKYLRRELKNLA